METPYARPATLTSLKQTSQHATDDEEEFYEEEVLEEEHEDAHAHAQEHAHAHAHAQEQEQERARQQSPRENRTDEPLPTLTGTAVSGMADMIAAAASRRTERVGEQGVQAQKAPAKKPLPFRSIADEAAGYGKFLFGNKEKVVEAVAPAKSHLRSEKENPWRGPSDITKHYFRSAHNTIVKEAAAQGAQLSQLKRFRPVETKNYQEPTDKPKPSQEQQIDRNSHRLDSKGRPIQRQQFLIDEFLEDKNKEHDKEWELKQALQLLHVKKPQDIQLPTKQLPKLQLKNASDHGAVSVNVDANPIASMAASQARERTLRLGKHNAKLKVLEKCPCPYCENPNPFQTIAYIEEREKRKQNPDLERLAQLEIMREQEERRQKTEAEHKKAKERIIVDSSKPRVWQPPKRTAPPSRFVPPPPPPKPKSYKFQVPAKPVPVPVNSSANGNYNDKPKSTGNGVYITHGDKLNNNNGSAKENVKPDTRAPQIKSTPTPAAEQKPQIVEPNHREPDAVVGSRSVPEPPATRPAPQTPPTHAHAPVPVVQDNDTVEIEIDLKKRREERKKRKQQKKQQEATGCACVIQ